MSASTDAEQDYAHVARLATGRTWDEQPVGFAFRSAARTIVEADLAAFVNLCGLNGPTFLDARHAEGSGYAGRVIPGLMTLSFAEGLVFQTNILSGTGIAFLGLDLDIKAPVYVGDTLEVIVEVIESRPTSSGGRGVVRTRNTVLNQRAEPVLIYTPLRLQRGSDAVTTA